MEHSDDWEKIARRDVTEGLWRQRTMLLAGGWLSTLTGVGLCAIALIVRDVPPLVAISLVATACMLMLMAAGMQFAPKRYTYRIVVAWLLAVQFTILSQLALFYFGPEREIFLSGRVPLLVTVLPVMLVAARAYLNAADARLLNMVFLVALAALSLGFLLLYWNVADSRYALLLMASASLLAAPLTELLLALHDRARTVAAQARREALERAEGRALAAENALRTDELTGLRNRRGVKDAVRRAFETRRLTGVARVDLRERARLEVRLGAERWQQLVLAMSRALSQSTAGDERLGRSAESQFTLWTEGLADEEAWGPRVEAVRAQVQAALRAEHYEVDVVAGGGVWPGGSNADLALEQADFDCYVGNPRETPAAR